MLLFNVRVNVGPATEARWNDWHYSHMPHLIATPGYHSARRYLAISDDAPRYAALYEIDEAALPELLGGDFDRRHPLTLMDGPKFEAEIAADVDHFAYSIYVPVEPGDATLVTGDLPYVEIRLDVATDEQDAVLKLLTADVAPQLRQHSGVAEARVYEALDDPSIQWLGSVPTPPVMLQLQFHDLAAATAFALADPNLSALQNAPGVDKLDLAAYRQIARFWPLPAEIYAAHTDESAR